MNAILRSNRERWKPRRSSHRFRRPLIQRDLSIRHAFGIHRAHPAQERMNRKMSAFVAMIQP